MNQLLKLSTALFLVAVAFTLKMHAQTTSVDVPRILSYQGQVTTTDGKAMNGMHHITASLYSDPHGTNAVWKGEYDAEIHEGLFSVDLGFGKYPLPASSTLNRPLWVSIAVDGGAELQPFTRLSAVPYALNVPDKSITLAKLAPDVVLVGASTPKIQTILANPCGTNNDGFISVLGYCWWKG